MAFNFTELGSDPEWFIVIIQSRPAAVASVLVEHVAAMLKARKDHIGGVYELAHDDAYAGVAQVAVMQLLRVFPERAQKKQVSEVLGKLLKSALRYLNDSEIKGIIDEKLAISKLDVTQRIYWLAAGLVVAPRDYEPVARVFVGKSRARIQGLAAFFIDRSDRRILREGTHESSLAYLVRMFAPVCSPERLSGDSLVTPAKAM